MCIIYLSSLFCLALNFYLVHGQTACRTYPQGILGTCLPLANCPRLSDVLKLARKGDNDATNTLRKSVCTVDPGSSSTLCCENVIPEPLSPSHGLPSNSNCGHEKLGDNIVGGQNADYWWPWVVLLYGLWIETPGKEGHFCGGTLITDRFVITAAHCKDIKIAIKSVSIGELITNNDPDTNGKGITAPPVQEIPVADFIAHSQHRTPCKKCNDIAIIKLAHSVILIEGFSTPICLPLRPVQDMKMSLDEYPGIVAMAAGWGSTSKNPYVHRTPEHLQEVQLDVDSTKDFCQRVTHQHPTGSFLCAGAEGKDTCRGDSGGPLMVTDAFGLRWYLAGITSFGSTVCGASGTQGVYTSVRHYLPWIIQNLR